MLKYELKSGMVVELKNSRRFIVSNFNSKLVLLSKSSVLMLDGFKDDLIHKKYKSLNIEKVFKFDKPIPLDEILLENSGTLIWARKLKLTLTDIEEKYGVNPGTIEIMQYNLTYKGIDLKPGMILESRSGSKYYLIPCEGFLGYLDDNHTIIKINDKILKQMIIKKIYGPENLSNKPELIYEEKGN